MPLAPMLTMEQLTALNHLLRIEAGLPPYAGVRAYTSTLKELSDLGSYDMVTGKVTAEGVLQTNMLLEKGEAETRRYHHDSSLLRQARERYTLACEVLRREANAGSPTFSAEVLGDLAHALEACNLAHTRLLEAEWVCRESGEKLRQVALDALRAQ